MTKNITQSIFFADEPIRPDHGDLLDSRWYWLIEAVSNLSDFAATRHRSLLKRFAVKVICILLDGVSLVCSLVVIAFTIFCLSADAHVLIIGAALVQLLMWLTAAVLFSTAPPWLEKLGNSIESRAYSYMQKSWKKKVQKWDAVHGWRPRERFMHPKGRDDTYDRYRVEVELSAGAHSIYLRVGHWTYTAVGWHRVEDWNFNHDGCQRFAEFPNTDAGHAQLTVFAKAVKEKAHQHEINLHLAICQRKAIEEANRLHALEQANTVDSELLIREARAKAVMAAISEEPSL